MKSFPLSNALGRLPEQFFAGLVQRAQRLITEGHDVILLGQGNPDLPTPEHIVSALQDAAAKPRFHQYPPFRGYDFLKQAAADFYDREYDVQVDAEREVAILMGGKVGLVEISQCLLNAGDTALVPDPGYPDYWSGIAMVNAHMHMMPLREEADFLPDYDAVPEEVKSRAKLMFLNYPNNPTAATATPSFFSDTVKFADQNEICVVHDFAYGGIGFDGQKPLSFLQTPKAKEVGIEIYTLSKTYNMAGWRIAFAVGNPHVIEALKVIQDHFHCSVFGGIQAAAAVALRGRQDCVGDLVRTYESREQAHVVVAPGNGFGSWGEGYVRAGLLDSEDRLMEAVQRIEKLGISN